jgi:predicted DNA-binding transcriptional regulator AlpA
VPTNNSPNAVRHLDRRVDQILNEAPTAPDDQLLTTKETAAWLGVSTVWLAHRRHYGDGGPPYKKLSTRVLRYSRGDVRQWLESRKRTGVHSHAR